MSLINTFDANKASPETVESLEQELSFLNQYYTANLEQQDAYTKINYAIKETMFAVIYNCPPCADRTNAIRLLREARMWANSSVALNGRV